MDKLSFLLKSILGDRCAQLLKSITREQTASVIDITELNDSFQIAPKSVLAWLMVNVSPMNVGESRELAAPWDKDAIIIVNKKASDVYSGYFAKNGKKEHSFELCSIPQLAAHILSFFELYDEALLDHKMESKEDDRLQPEPEQAAVIVEEKKQEDSIADKIQLLCNQVENLNARINAFIMLSTLQNHLQKSASTSNKTKNLHKILKYYNKLQKTPRPPAPGKNVGSNVHGVTHAGVHGNKTAYSDFNPRGGQTQTSLSPYLKSGQSLSRQFGLPSQPTQPKQSKNTFKSEGNSVRVTCRDCFGVITVDKEVDLCHCFTVLSAPKALKKSDKWTFVFGRDWTDEDKKAFLDTLMTSIIKTKK